MVYSIIHDSRWIVALFLGVWFGVLHSRSKGLLKEGLEEYRRWKHGMDKDRKGAM